MILGVNSCAQLNWPTAIYSNTFKLRLKMNSLSQATNELVWHGFVVPIVVPILLYCM